MNQLHKKLFIWLVVSALALFILNLTIDNPYTHRILRNIVNEKLADTGFSVSFESLSVRAMPPGLKLYGIEIAAKQDGKKLPLANAAEVGVKLSVWSFFYSEMRLRSLEINGLVVNFGDPNLWSALESNAKKKKPTKSSPPETWPPSTKIPLDMIIIHQAQLAWNNGQKGSDALGINLGSVDAEVEINNLKRPQGKVKIGNFSFSVAESMLLSSTKVETSFEGNENEINFNALDLSGPNIAMAGNCQIELQKSPKKVLEKISIRPKLEGKADLEILGIFLGAPNSSGLVTGSALAEIGIPLKDDATSKFQIKGTGKVDGAILDGFKLRQSQTDFVIDHEKMAFENLRVNIENKNYGQGRGAIYFNKEANYEFQFSLDQMPLTELLSSLQVENFDVLDTSLSSRNVLLKGTSIPFQMRVESNLGLTDFKVPLLNLEKTRFPNSPSCKASMIAKIDAEKLVLSSSEGNCQSNINQFSQIETSPFSLQAKFGFTDKSGMEMSVGFPRLPLDFANYFTQRDFSGSARVSAEVKGPYDKILTHITADGTQTAIENLDLGNVKGSVTAGSRELTWNKVTATPDSGGNIELGPGKLGYTDAYPTKLTLSASNLKPSFVAGLVELISGEKSVAMGINELSGRFQGPLAAPLLADMDLQASTNSLSLDSERIFDHATFRMVADEKQLRVVDSNLDVGNLSAEGSLVINRARGHGFEETKSRGDLLGKLGIFPVDRISAKYHLTAAKKDTGDNLVNIPFGGHHLKDVGIRGGIDADLDLQGTVGRVSGVASGKVKQISFLGSNSPEVTFKTFVDGGKFDTIITQGGNMLSGRVSLDVSKEGIPFQWYLQFRRYDFRAILTEAFHRDPRNFAYLSGDWRAKGNFRDWWMSEHEFEINEVQLRYGPPRSIKSRRATVQLKKPATLYVKNHQWGWKDGKNLTLEGDGLTVTASATKNYLPKELGVQLTGTASLALLEKLIDEVEQASGNLVIDGNLTGPIDSPNIQLRFADSTSTSDRQAPAPLLGLRSLRPPFRNIQVAGELKNSQLKIDYLNGDKGAGKVTLKGTIELDSESNQESRLELDLRNGNMVVDLPFMKTIETDVTGNLLVTGHDFPYSVGGTINIDRAKSFRDFDIYEEILKALREKRIKTSSAEEPPLAKLDLNIASKDSVIVNNKNIQAVLGLDLHLGGTDTNPQITGQIETTKGKFKYKRDFRIIRGTVQFDDPNNPDPNIDITAVSDVPPYEVTIVVTGRASNPQVELVTDPPTREDGTPIDTFEILILLSRGSLPETNRAIGDTQGTALAEGINIIAAQQVETQVSKLFELSGQNIITHVYIDAYASEETGAPIYRVNMPINLLENLDLVLRVDKNKRWKASSEYPLHDNITVSGAWEPRSGESSISDSGGGKLSQFDFNLNLKFRFSYQ